MKQLIHVGVLSLLTAFSLFAEESTISKEDAKKIFRENVIEAKDMQKYAEQYANMLSMMQPTTLSIGELTQICSNELAANEEAYLALVVESFGPKDVEDVLKLLDNPLYLKYRDSLWQLGVKSLTQAGQKMQTAIAANPVAVVAPAVIHPIIEMQKENYDEMIKGSKYVVVDVYADWCGPCKMLAPTLQALSDEYGSLYTFTKLNVTPENESLVNAIQVRALPTIIFYKEGKEVGRSAGLVDKEHLKTLMEGYFTEGAK